MVDDLSPLEGTSNSYCLSKDIVLTNFNSIIVFSGRLYSNGHTITVESFSSGASGIFARLGQTAEIHNLIVKIKSTADLNLGPSAGILAGTNNGTIKNVGVIATDAGGLVGENRGSTTITNSYATGAVSSAGDDVGGLVGKNGDATSAPRLHHLIATGAVHITHNMMFNSNDPHAAGGLVGYFGNRAATQTSTYLLATGKVTTVRPNDAPVGGLVGDWATDGPTQRPCTPIELSHSAALNLVNNNEQAKGSLFGQAVRLYLNEKMFVKNNYGDDYGNLYGGTPLPEEGGVPETRYRPIVVGERFPDALLDLFADSGWESEFWKWAIENKVLSLPQPIADTLSN